MTETPRDPDQGVQEPQELNEDPGQPTPQQSERSSGDSDDENSADRGTPASQDYAGSGF